MIRRIPEGLLVISSDWFGLHRAELKPEEPIVVVFGSA